MKLLILFQIVIKSQAELSRIVLWSQTEFSKSRTCIKYLLTKVGLPVTKEVQDLCLRLSPSDELVAVTHKAMARPASLKILERVSVSKTAKKVL